MVQRRIILDVKKAGVYSILADETKDCSKREQLSIVLRYIRTSGVSNDKLVISNMR